MTDEQQPYRPPIRGRNYYAAMNNCKQEITAKRKDIFSMTITASKQQEGENMNNQLNGNTEQQILIDLVFKPVESGLKLHPEEIQLLLAYMGEILKELEAEEQSTTGKESI